MSGNSNCTGNVGGDLTTTIATVFFVVGAVFLAVTSVMWAFLCSKWRKQKYSNTILRYGGGRAPSVSVIRRAETLQKSGDYIDFQGSFEASNVYDEVKTSPKLELSSRYTRDEFEETYDGSRMPRVNAPPPPRIITGNVRDSTKRKLAKTRMREIPAVRVVHEPKSTTMYGSGDQADGITGAEHDNGLLDTYEKPGQTLTRKGGLQQNDSYEE